MTAGLTTQLEALSLRPYQVQIAERVEALLASGPAPAPDPGDKPRARKMTTFADLAANIAEKAAILEHDNGLPRTDAEAQAIAEVLDLAYANRHDPANILGELIRAGRMRHAEALLPLLQNFGLHATRAALWGFGHIVVEGEGYRPALPGELAEAAFIAPAFEGGRLADLVAQPIGQKTFHTRLGVAKALGIDAIEESREHDLPLFIFPTIDAWLRGNCSGAVIIDLTQAAHLLDGIKSILCHASRAATLHRATRRCWPRPTIASPGSHDLAA
ncbi:MAG: hypothetical protein AB7O44_32435 [Hyphomicrobiaceae bacterium]